MVAAVASCSKSERSVPEKESRMVTLRVYAEKEAPTPAVKAEYDWNANEFSFEDDDQMLILIGKTSGSSVTSQTSVRLNMEAGAPGVFSGTFDIGDYELSDIRGAVLVKPETPASIYSLSFYNSTLAAVFKMTKAQTQTAAGVFSDKTGRFMLYGPIASTSLSQDDENDGLVALTKVKFKYCSALFEYHIYGAGRSDEKVQSISVAAAGSSVSSSYILTCNHMISATAAGHQAVNGNYAYESSVTMETPFAVPADADNAGVIYHCVYGSGEIKRQLSDVTVTTDKAIYKATPTADHYPLAQFGCVTPIYINLAEGGMFTRYTSAVAEYSTDGGATWTEWDGDLPSGSGYTRLAVKSASALLSTQIASINTWISAQDSAVDLDLSQTTYETVVFPAVFGSSTAANANTKLRSIKFPSNITEIAANSFYNCTGLVTADLSKVVTLRGNAFRNCSLLSDLVSLGKLQDAGSWNNNQYAFGYCTSLTSVTLPAIKTMGQYMFRGCTSLVEAQFGAACTSVGGHLFNGCTKLAKITCLATTAPGCGGNTKNIAVSAKTGGTIYVPYSSDHSVLASYMDSASTDNPWYGAVKSSSWTIVELPEE